jgi:hypothetical protein
MRRAAQRLGVAIALHQIAPGLCRERRIDIEVCPRPQTPRPSARADRCRRSSDSISDDWPRLVVADATVDQDRVVRDTNDIGLKAQDQRVGRVDRPRIAQPLPVLSREVGSQSGEHIMHRPERGLLLDEAVNGEVAGGEFEAYVALPLFRPLSSMSSTKRLKSSALFTWG